MATESVPTSSVSLLDLIEAGQNAPEAKELEARMVNAAKQSLSIDEIREQRLSFVMGMLPHDSTMTREDVRKLLESHYG